MPMSPAAPAAAPLEGLSEGEAQARRARGQDNTAPPRTGRSYREIVVENVFTFTNVALFGLGVLLALVGRPLDGLLSTGVIGLNVLVSVVQEVRAKRTLDRIALLTRPKARVVRDGQERALLPEELVLGDVLVVGAGDQIVVDGRVVGDGRLAVDESQLTGESELIPKRAGDPVRSGSFCVSGSARYVAERVGRETLASQITAGARAFRRVLTPLQREIHLVIRLVLLIVAGFELLLLARALLSGTDLASSVQNATVVAGLVPNGLFLSISVAYALAAVRIVRQGVLVQQSNAIEALSHVDTLCLDKTGTLTANRLRVLGLYPTAPELAEAELGRVLGAVVASATSHNQTSAAIASAYPAHPHRLVGEVPFSSARKWSAVALDDVGGAGDDEPRLQGVYVLGATELVRPSRPDADGTAAAFSSSWDATSARARDLAAQGARVLVIAHAPMAVVEDEGDASRLPAGLVPLGLVSLADQLRPEARGALAAFSQAGVRPKIISGDDPETVAALARAAGLDPGPSVVSGPQLAALDDAAFASAAASGVVFGRVVPQQKERLVRALQAGGASVAMIGDGVNDVLSLKAADVGIAMQSGSQAARGVADLVLLEDSFASLVPSVAEGQRIVNGMVPILQLFLTRISTFGLVILSALVIGEFPLALRQASLVTTLSVGVPTLFLALWAQPGPLPKGSIPRRVAHFVLTPVVITSGIALLLFYGMLLLNLVPFGAVHVRLFDLELAPRYAVELSVAQTGLATFLVLTGLLLLVFAAPPSPWWVGAEPLSADRRPALLAAGLALVFLVMRLTPPLAALFGMADLGTPELLLVGLASVVWLLLVRAAWRGRWVARFLGSD